MSKCPCNSSIDYKKCCEPYITGKEIAPSPEALMRARYTAYEKVKVDYIIDSCIPERRDQLSRDNITEWAEKSDWQKLEIIKVEEDDSEGKVEFKAFYDIDGDGYIHHEVAEFKKQDGQWFFFDGKIVPRTKRREGKKTGRNDPCTCGSGKKYKKCCLNK